MKKIYEEMTVKQTMNRVTEPRMPFEWSINPYRGCIHGCSFCYARSTHSFLGMEVDDSFQNHIFLKTNAAEALEAQLLRKLRKHGGNLSRLAEDLGEVAIGTATDPYQPLEGKVQLTRECLKILSKYQVPTSITTRSPLILRDLDLLTEMNITSINISLNTLNEEFCRMIEPATPLPRKRLETVQQLVNHGLTAGIFIAPILPKLTDSTDQLEELVREAKAHQAMYAVPSVLRLKPGVKSWYFKTLETCAPDLLAAYAKQYQTAYPSHTYVEALMTRVYSILEAYDLPSHIPEREQPLSSESRDKDEQLAFWF